MKKRIFSVAVAAAVAMSLSVSAFAAAGPGMSDAIPGWSDVVGGSETETSVNVNPDGETVITTDNDLQVVAPKGAFPDGVTSVTLVASVGVVKSEYVESIVRGINGLVDTDHALAKVTYGMSLELLDQNRNPIQPVKDLTVSIAQNSNNKLSNTVVYLSDDGKEATSFTLNKDGRLFKFSVPHFSKYYLGILDDSEQTTTTTTTTTSGGFVDPDGNNTTTTTSEETTTTTAPATSDNNGGSNSGDDTTAASSDIDSNGTGDSNNGSGDSNNGSTDGTGSDKNQATGVVLAVIPAAIAAAAVVISKKRK